jgi:hypothetical protein
MKCKKTLQIFRPNTISKQSPLNSRYRTLTLTTLFRGFTF